MSMRNSLHWNQIAFIASVIWVIAGGFWGVRLAVAPAVSAYQACVAHHGPDQLDCKSRLERDWPTYSGHRLYYAAAIGLTPLPIIWLVAYGFFGMEPDSVEHTTTVETKRLSGNDRRRLKGSGKPI